MNPFAQLLALLSSTLPLHCTLGEVANALSSVVHITPENFFSIKVPTYSEKIAEEVKDLAIVAESKGVYITTDYTSNELPDNSLAYHAIKGMVMAESRWYFSSMQLEKDLLAADNNPQINAHFLHVNSGGGEAWYLDQLANTLASLKKPIYTYSEKVMASAAYYIGVHGSVIKTRTQNDTIGSIGTILDGWDIISYFEKMGLTRLRATATNSDLKNKMYEDFRKGEDKQVIEEVLDPFQNQFANTVRSARPILNYDDTHPIFRAETFLGNKAVENKLIDGVCTIEQALSEANQIGLGWKSTATINNQLSNIFKN